MKTPILLVITAVISSAVTYATIRALDGQAASVATSVEAPVNQADADALAVWKKAKAEITGGFFDPEAVRFRCVKYFDSGDKKSFSGFLNGKNRFGAYVGEQSFYWSTVKEPSIPTIYDKNPDRPEDCPEVDRFK